MTPPLEHRDTEATPARRPATAEEIGAYCDAAFGSDEVVLRTEKELDAFFAQDTVCASCT